MVMPKTNDIDKGKMHLTYKNFGAKKSSIQNKNIPL